MDYHALLISLFFAMGCAPLAFFFPSCLCCGTPVNCGTGCSSTPSSIAVTLTGFSNGTCTSCADYNATYICSKADFLGPCYYRVLPAMSCEIPPAGDSVDVQLSASGGNTTIRVDCFINGNSATNPPGQTVIVWRDLNLGTARQDCANLGTIVVPWLSSTSSDRCAHDGSDATVTFS